MYDKIYNGTFLGGNLTTAIKNKTKNQNGGAAKTQVKDLFGFEMISLNKFTTAQIDKNTWTKDMLDLLMDFIEKENYNFELYI